MTNHRSRQNEIDVKQQQQNTQGTAIVLMPAGQKWRDGQ